MQSMINLPLLMKMTTGTLFNVVVGVRVVVVVEQDCADGILNAWCFCRSDPLASFV